MAEKLVRLFVRTRKQESYIASVPLQKLDEFFRALKNLDAGVSKIAG